MGSNVGCLYTKQFPAPTVLAILNNFLPAKPHLGFGRGCEGRVERWRQGSRLVRKMDSSSLTFKLLMNFRTTHWLTLLLLGILLAFSILGEVGVKGLESEGNSSNDLPLDQK